MSTNRSGVFRGCHVFDTHEASFHLDGANRIVGLESDTIKAKIFGETTGIIAQGAIGNPVVFALDNMSDSEKDEILEALNIAYAERITRWLNLQEETIPHQAAA